MSGNPDAIAASMVLIKASNLMPGTSILIPQHADVLAAKYPSLVTP